jgi:hypothetical protein
MSRLRWFIHEKPLSKGRMSMACMLRDVIYGRTVKKEGKDLANIQLREEKKQRGADSDKQTSGLLIYASHAHMQSYSNLLHETTVMTAPLEHAKIRTRDASVYKRCPASHKISALRGWQTNSTGVVW